MNISFFFNLHITLILSCIVFGIAAWQVIFFKNQVLSVFSLILVFLLGAVLILTLGADFLAFIYIIVYMGAVAVLFLFVVMMLQIKNTFNPFWTVYSPLSGFCFLLFSFIFFLSMNFFTVNGSFLYFEWFNSANVQWNIVLLGQLVYTYFFLYFIFSSLILLVSLIGAILMTLPVAFEFVPTSFFSVYNRFLKTSLFVNLKKNKHFFLSAGGTAVGGENMIDVIVPPLFAFLCYGGMFVGCFYFLRWQYRVAKLKILTQERAEDRRLFYENLGVDILKKPELLKQFSYPKGLVSKLRKNRSWRKHDLDVYQSVTGEYRGHLFDAYSSYYTTVRLWWQAGLGQIKTVNLPVPTAEYFHVSPVFAKTVLPLYERAGTFRYLLRYQDMKIVQTYLESKERFESFTWYEKILYYLRVPLYYIRQLMGIEVNGTYQFHVFHLISNMQEITRQALYTKAYIFQGKSGITKALYPRDKEIIDLYKLAMSDVSAFKVCFSMMLAGAVIGFVYIQYINIDNYFSGSPEVAETSVQSSLEYSDVLFYVKNFLESRSIRCNTSSFDSLYIGSRRLPVAPKDFVDIVDYLKSKSVPQATLLPYRIPLQKPFTEPIIVPNIFPTQVPIGLVDFFTTNFAPIMTMSWELLKQFF